MKADEQLISGISFDFFESEEEPRMKHRRNTDKPKNSSSLYYKH